jgi:4-hydroxythreonine-4-phosphate dehydrogenase
MLIAITPGDPEGVGPEVVCKTLLKSHSDLPADARFVCIGAAEPLRQCGARLIELDEVTDEGSLPRTRPGELLVLAAPELPGPRAGRHSKKAISIPGFQSGWSIERASRLVLAGVADALVTGPISKERLQAGGYPFPGHTEMLASLCRKKEVTMMLANDQLRITLVTTHVALRDVSRAVTAREIARAVRHTVDSLRQWWGIRRPRVAICALNPHAGESGLFGKEEIRTISPTIRKLQRQYGNDVVLQGPLPADTLFANHVATPPAERADAVVCMYHDQGLIPVKLLDFPRTVNVSLGLPMVRTSVDHGVAFDIAGTGRADPSSFRSALKLACEIARIRKENRK